MLYKNKFSYIVLTENHIIKSLMCEETNQERAGKKEKISSGAKVELWL